MIALYNLALPSLETVSCRSYARWSRSRREGRWLFTFTTQDTYVIRYMCLESRQWVVWLIETLPATVRVCPVQHTGRA